MKDQNCINRILIGLVAFSAIYSNAHAFQSDKATEFMLYVKQGSFEKAYELLSPDTKAQISFGEFEKKQKNLKSYFEKIYGAGRIVRVEEIKVNLNGPLLNEESVKRFFSFGKVKMEQRFYQCIFSEGKAALFNMELEHKGGSLFITKFEYDPQFQTFLLSGQAKTEVKIIA